MTLPVAMNGDSGTGQTVPLSALPAVDVPDVLPVQKGGSVTSEKVQNAAMVKGAGSGIEKAAGVGNHASQIIGNQPPLVIGNQLRERDWMVKGKHIPPYAKVGVYESNGIQYARYWWREPGIRKLEASYIAPLRPVRSGARMDADEQAKVKKLLSRLSRNKRHNRNTPK